jgi:predicted lipid-binding transport protein (Tim44 family)
MSAAQATSAPDPPKPAAKPGRWGILLGALGALLLVVVLGIVSSLGLRAPRRAAKDFLALVRAGEGERAMASASPELAARAAAAEPGDDLRRTLAQIRRSRDSTFSRLSEGSGVACMDGALEVADGERVLYVELREKDGVWRVSAVSQRGPSPDCVDDD